MVLVYLVPIIITVALSLNTEGFGFSFKFNAFNRAEYKELTHFSWYHFLLSLSITLMGFLDGLALPLYDHNGFRSVAIYSVVIFLMSFMQIPSKAMMTPTNTVLSQAIANDDNAKAKNIFSRSSINVLIATLFMVILIFCNLDNAVALIAKGYEQIIPLFLILCIGRLVDLSTGLNDVILSITKHYKFSFYVSIIMITLLFVLIRIWVPQYGVFGAAWSTTVTLIVFNICKYIFVWKKLGMQPFSAKTPLVIIAGLPALAAGYFFPHFLSNLGHMYIYTLIDVGIRSTIIVVVYMLMLFWLRPSADLEEYIASIKKNKRLF
jgi:O-antigen/teichoic acid export membrane protein